MKLHDLKPPAGSTRPKRRVGRGIAGKGGKTAGRGTKGQGARGAVPVGFEGGQMPLARRVPKRGFFNGKFKKVYTIVNLDDIEARFEAGAVVDEAALRGKGLVKGQEFDGIKILGDGTPTKALEVHATKFSASAAEKLAKAGGKAVVVPYKPHAVRTVPTGE
jgi:large subunit ribosomal protein L15